MPVLRDGFVDEADVVITPDQPLGIWHVQGLEVAPLLRRVWTEPVKDVLAGLTPEQSRVFKGWLVSQGYRPSPSPSGRGD